MRIVCPRCVAKYEIDESIIPEIGHEVQCENCGNIWFQDFVEILPEAGTTKIHQKDQTIFDKVDDKPEATFYSSRGLDLNKDDAADGKFNNDVDDTFGSEKGEDDIPATNITMPPTIAEVLEVLRSEAIFSSSRNQLDAKTRNTLNYNEPEHNEPEVNEATLSALPNGGSEAVDGSFGSKSQHADNKGTTDLNGNTLENQVDETINNIDIPEIIEHLDSAINTNQKEIRPNINELDASQDLEDEETHYFDYKMTQAHENVALKGSRDGFRYAFIWTVFIIALFIASYILRPELVAALPHAAIVLDPYAAAIDYIRIVINGLLI